MKAAVLVKLNEPVVVKELAIPKLSFGQVLVKIHASGICGAQMGEISGANGDDKYLPHLLGHEGGGEVLEIGPGVSTVRPRDRVVLHWRKGTGMEANPPTYLDENGNEVGAGWVTTFSESAVISENRLTVIDDDVPFDIAALMGCAVTTGLGLINNEAKLKIGRSIMVVGCGGVGLNVIQGAKLAGGNPIIAVDVHRSKLELAEKFGATHFINNRNQSDLRAFDNVDVFVDCTGDTSIISFGYSIAKKTILVGQPKKGECLKIPNVRNCYCGKVLMDSQGGLTDPSVDIPNYLKLYKSGRLNLDDLITHRFKLEEVNEAMSMAYSGKAVRCVLEMRNV